jgi:phosphoglycerate dehydrogenase-like enzyme
MKILACDGIHADGLNLFKEAGFTVETSDPIKDLAVLAEKLQQYDGIMVRSATLITAESLARPVICKSSAVPVPALIRLMLRPPLPAASR